MSFILNIKCLLLYYSSLQKYSCTYDEMLWLNEALDHLTLGNDNNDMVQ